MSQIQLITGRIFIHWKSTLWGLLGAGAVALGEYLLTGAVTLHGAEIAIVVAIKGAISTDLSGGIATGTQ